MKNLYSRTKLTGLLATACLGLAQFAHAQCPEICDSNENTALGQSALVNNSSGMNNTAVGFQALQNSNADGNTATGYQALKSNTSGSFNTAYGQQALTSNTTSDNTAFGAFALSNNIIGGQNTAVGYEALSRTTAGVNTALGSEALANNTRGSGNIAIGSSAGIFTTGSNNIDIGNAGAADENSTIRIGARGTHTNTYIAAIHGHVIAGGVGVLIDNQGHLGTNTSSARYKEQIKPMDKASEGILSLQPVAFHYKKELDPQAIPQFGLVAEQVEEVNPDLVARDDEGKPYTVRYEAVNAMLLNEFLKEHRKVEEQVRINQQQQATIAELQSHLQAITATLKEQALQIQKVSAPKPADKSAPGLALTE